MNDDIIVAIATSRLEAAISIIRVSGPDCIAFVQKFFTGKILEKPSHTINYGFIIDEGKKIDEVLVNIYRGKRTFTGEEMVEINCHGGVYITSKVLEVCIKNGARMAERGEFSKRAFLNGRIDLSQAEAISDIITAKNSYATDLALKGITGNISNFIETLKEDLIQIITQIEVNIDYPEYDDVEELTASSLLPRSSDLLAKMNEILENSKNIKLIKEGIKTVIIGRPNVGKSSLLNALLDEDKAIVTDIAGTTRDIVEGSISIDGIVLNMIDTAGIRETDDIIESIGVEKSKELVHQADLVLLVIDGSQELSDEDKQLLELTKDATRIIVINKIDQGIKVDLQGVKISAKDNQIGEILKFNIDGFTVLVGKNNKQNDYITLKLANNEDIWFHVKDFPGSHVVLRTENKIPSQDTINKCANLAKKYSKANQSSNINVDYTYIKYVKKQNKAKPGMVIYTNNKTVIVH